MKKNYKKCWLDFDIRQRVELAQLHRSKLTFQEVEADNKIIKEIVEAQLFEEEVTILFHVSLDKNQPNYTRTNDEEQGIKIIELAWLEAQACMKVLKGFGANLSLEHEDKIVYPIKDWYGCSLEGWVSTYQYEQKQLLKSWVWNSMTIINENIDFMIDSYLEVRTPDQIAKDNDDYQKYLSTR